MKTLHSIAAKFMVDSPVTQVAPLGEGFINDTYVAQTQSGTRYILQRKNRNIFTNIPSMIDNIDRVTAHIKTKVVRSGGDPSREAMTLIGTAEKKLYHLDTEGQYWTMCLFIEDTLSYNRADTPQIAIAGGRGIGRFQAMLSDFDTPLINILPGFHDMTFRFEQWDGAISADPHGRVNQVKSVIDWVEARRNAVLEVWSMVKNGHIPTRVTHNDTKINNILFDKNGDVLCIIDLDTVLSATILNDFGDAVRTYTNTGAEDDIDPSRVTMSLPMFEGLAKGYLSEAKTFLTRSELDNLAYAGIYITTEQVLRFAMDYISGDTYYKIKHPAHNLQRSLAQMALVESMEEQYDRMKKIIDSPSR